MRKKGILFLIITLLSLNTIVLAQDDNEAKTNNRPIDIELADEAAIVIGGIRITLSDAIKKAIDSNQDILSGKYDVAMSDTGLEKFQSKYGARLNANGGVSSTDYPDQTQTQTGKNKKAVDISASLSKSFSTGTTVAGGFTDTYANYTGMLGHFDPTNPLAYQEFSLKTNNPVIFLSLEQELLKNSFGYNDRNQEKILKNTTLAQKDSIIYGLSLVVVGVIVDYWNVIISKTHLDNSTMMLQETKKVRRIILDNVNLGLAEQYEMNYWNSQIATSEASLTRAEQSYRDAIRKFLQTVNMPAENYYAGESHTTEQTAGDQQRRSH